MPIPSPARLERLVAALGSDPRYAVGARRFPERVNDDESIAIAEALCEEFDHGSTRRAELAAQAGMRIHCHSGCSTCCEIMVVVYRPEAVRIARHLSQPENHALRERFLAAYHGWRAAVGDAPERLAELFKQGRQADYDSLHMTHWRKRVQCAFNEGGACSIYPVRPMACRNAHALDTDAYCRADAPEGKKAAAVDFVPLSRFMATATRLLRATHNAGAGSAHERHHQEAVCSAVYKILVSAK